MITKLYSKLSIFLMDTKGVTGIEYSLIAAVIGGGIMAAAMGMGDSLFAMFNGEDGLNSMMEGVTSQYSGGDNGGMQ